MEYFWNRDKKKRENILTLLDVWFKNPTVPSRANTHTTWMHASVFPFRCVMHFSLVIFLKVIDPKCYKNSNKSYIYLLLEDQTIMELLKISPIVQMHPTFEEDFFMFLWAKLQFLYRIGTKKLKRQRWEKCKFWP